MHRMVCLVMALTLGACIPQSTTPDGEVGDRFTDRYPNTTVGLGCVDGAVGLAWTVDAHPMVVRYDALVTHQAGEVRVSLGAEGSGQQDLPPGVADGCTPCTVALIPVDAEGIEGAVILTVETDVDGDGDGFAGATCGGSDCDDEDDSVHPDAVEACNLADDDCNGIVDDLPDAPLAARQDGVCQGAVQVCNGAGWAEPDYTQITGYEATETTCDGLDNDCSGQADDLSNAPLADLQDGVCTGQNKVCDGSGGWIEPDYTGITGFEATEVSCDGLDNDCSGQADDLSGAPAADEQDGVCAGASKVCDGSGGWIEPDYAQLANYAELDDCDGLDNDCDGDADDEGTAQSASNQFGICAGSVQVCDGSNGWVDPDITQLTGYLELDDCDGLDTDCDDDVDDEGTPGLASNQVGVCAGAMQVCDGSNGWIDPDYAAAVQDFEADEISCDALDNDCDGTVDTDAPLPDALDQDGVCAGAKQVCDGVNGFIEPDYSAHSNLWEQTETLCDGEDNDCSGSADDVIDPPLADLQDGVCTGSTKTCDGTDWNEPAYTSITGYEVDEVTCDGDDNDCDGVTDTDIAGTPPAEKQDGVCSGTLKVCDGQGNFVEPVYADVVANYEADESLCDGLNNDCDASTDEMAPVDAPDASKQDGVCAGALKVCAGSSGYVDPDYTAINGYEAIEATCDGDDNDCDGTVDTVFLADPDSAALECWGTYVRTVPERIADGPWRSVATSRSYGSGGWGTSCVIDESDQLYCWGDNWYGGLGDGDTSGTGRRAMEQVPGDWSEVFLDQQTVCALQTDNTLWCWGSDPGLSTRTYEPAQVGTATYKQVGVEDGRVCAIASDDTLWCWGFDRDRQLGLPVAGNEPAPVQVGAETWLDIATGEGHTCGIHSSGDIWCWGKNEEGQSGVDPTVDVGPITTPAVIAPPASLGWDAVSASADQTCALATDGAIWCWGSNRESQVSAGAEDAYFEPQLADAGPFNTVITAETLSCGTTVEGELVCWGFNLFEGMGTGQYESTGPVQIGSQLGEFASMGASVSCAISSADASLWCWGDNAGGRGTGTGAEVVRTYWDGVVRDVSGGEEFMCFIDDGDGSVWCMGRDGRWYGQLGLPGDLDRIAPVQVAIGDFVQVESAAASTCALASDGSRTCWGRDGGRLGLGTSNSEELTPVRDATRLYDHITMGPAGGCGVASADGTLYCWGSGSAFSVTPTQLGVEVWRTVARGDGNSICAIDPTGDLYCWGANGDGQLGVGDKVGRTYAERVVLSEAGPWAKVSLLSESTCAIKEDQSLWCWGRASYGSIPVGSTADQLTPVQVPGTWSDVGVGEDHSCALATDGSTWCSGDNYLNQLGKEYDENADDQLTPLLVKTAGSTLLGVSDNRTCVDHVEYTSQTCAN
ncbi:MAG: hypothetical protein KC912_21675 [Proteobacteria bacterium]|nr:hypothetical protein [Pseudomonadota bacterium]